MGEELRRAVKKRTVWVTFCAALLLLSVQPGFGVSKETIQMMTDLDNLQQQVSMLQRTVDAQTAIIKTLIQQASENINGMKAAMAKVQNVVQQDLASTNNRFDANTNQMQQLSASLDEAKGEISKLSDQVAQTQKILQTINTPPPQPAANAAPANSTASNSAAAPGAADAAAAPPPVPDPQSLYKSAYADYTQGQYPLAIQGFQEYLQDYGNTDLASNAQFYIGESYYLQKDYKNAITQYDKCIQLYPDGNKVAAAYLKKGYALLALGETTTGERELYSLIRKYPNSQEAHLARERLRRIRPASRRRRAG
ncbi:MAG: tol-pal system protein YbgF [Terriglobia bacterium]